MPAFVLGVIELLRTEPSLRRLWLSQVVSELGDWFQIVAIASIFPTDRHGTTVIASLIVARHIIAALTSPIAGVLADRMNRGHVMIAADLARVLVTLGFLFVRGPEDIVLIFALSLALEALSMLFEPAKGAAIPQVLPTNKLYVANALAGATWSAMLAIGCMLGGFATSLVGPKAAFLLNALSFALSAWFVARANVPPLPKQDPKSGGHRQSFTDGIRWLAQHPAQRSLLSLKSGALISGGAFVLVTVFADQLFSVQGSRFYQKGILMGLMLGGRGLGALSMPFAMARLFGKDVRGVTRALLVAFPMSMLFFAMFAWAPGITLATLALFFAHGGTSIVWVGSSQLLQVTVPNDVLGRVLSVDLLLVTVSIAVANALVAAALQAGFAPREVALGLAIAYVIPIAWWARAQRMHSATLVSHASAS